jgi:acylpyruvate hydrolase
MRILSWCNKGAPHLGLIHPGEAGKFVDAQSLDPSLPGDMVEFLALGEPALRRARAALNVALERTNQSWLDIGKTILLPVVPRPGKIICVGLNYAAHAKEGGNARPTYPDFFLRASTSLVAHRQPMLLPQVSARLDFEAELAIVIGRPVRHATEADALSAIAGYSCFNDGTVRDYQRRASQWTIGKNFDRTGAFGPWLVTSDEVPAGMSAMNICSRLNGQVMQQASTGEMLWSVAEIIVLLSECMTLEAGDVIATGTPAGVGYARTPPVFMRPGDQIEIEIEGLGNLSNPIEAQSKHGCHRV